MTQQQNQSVSRGQLMQAYGILAQASLEHLNVSERMDIIRLLRRVRPEVETLQGLLEDIRQRNQDIIGSGATFDAARVAEINEAVNEEASIEAHIDDPHVIPPAAFERLVESNPKWSAADILRVQDVFARSS